MKKFSKNSMNKSQLIRDFSAATQHWNPLLSREDQPIAHRRVKSLVEYESLKRSGKSPVFSNRSHGIGPTC